MTGFIILVLLIALLVLWRVLSRRIEEQQRKLDVLWSRSGDPRLIERVQRLEKTVEELRRRPSSIVREAEAPPAPVAAAAPRPLEAPPSLPVTPPALVRKWCNNCGKALPSPSAICECERKPMAPAPEPEFVRREMPNAPVPEPAFATVTPSLSDRLRQNMAGEEWEALVGGSWLNKLGVFVLVIGIALFLGYSFTRMGPPGRVAVSLAVSLALLGGGIVLERRARYTIFGRGLLGGGWAALYFTTYAMHAVSAAKVIDSPVVGSLLLLAVAVGMILNSLKYRSQTVTGLAYFLAFVTLTPVITPAAALSVIALVPLAASLLYISIRFGWSQMAVLGLIATYGTCASRGDSGASVFTAQTVFTTYWLLFETYDLFRARLRSAYTPWEQAIFPLNAAGFLFLSYAKWSASAPDLLYALSAAVAVTYLTSAVLRMFLRPPSSFPSETNSLERAFSGGYEGAITLTAALTAVSILLRFHGMQVQLGLLAEAETFFLAGLLFAEAYPRQLAAALFAGAFLKLILNDARAAGQTTLGRWSVKAWTPVAALSSMLFYLNRALKPADRYYGYAASAVAALILGVETPLRYLGPAWFALAAALFAVGWLRRLRDFRIQGYLTAGLALIGTATYQVHVSTGLAPHFRHPWISLLCAALLSYGGILCALRSSRERLEEWEQTGMRRFGSWSAALAMVSLAWRLLPGDYLGLGWMAVALLLLECGLRQVPDDFRLQSYIVAGLGALRVLLFNLIPVDHAGPLAPRLTIAGAAVLAYAIAARIYRAHVEAVSPRERSTVFDAGSATGTLFSLGAIWALLPAVVVAPAWAIVSLLLVECGLALNIPGLRLQGHIAAAFSVGRLFFANFVGLGTLGFVSHRVLTVVPVVCYQYYQWSRLSALRQRLQSWERPVARIYLYAAAVLVVVLMRFEMGRVFTVTGWAAFALTLLVFGHRWNNQDLRWQSYGLAALAFWRSWSTNFYAPDSFAGVSGRILTGAFVVACFYAAQVLTPRKAASPRSVERYGRLFYSAMATVLLAALLFYEVSGSMLTVAWGLEGVALLVAGFPLSDRVLRISGLTLFLVCVLKLFLWDLRHLETLYRILSFIVLGLMLVSVSWIYTRFREQLQRYL
jgi:uncharacterized membrane protein